MYIDLPKKTTLAFFRFFVIALVWLKGLETCYGEENVRKGDKKRSGKWMRKMERGLVFK